jgi:hypothetical protein
METEVFEEKQRSESLKDLFLLNISLKKIPHLPGAVRRG